MSQPDSRRYEKTTYEMLRQRLLNQTAGNELCPIDRELSLEPLPPSTVTETPERARTCMASVHAVKEQLYPRSYFLHALSYQGRIRTA
jgi:hypothetical protein